MPELTIQNHTFQVPVRYEEGHELSANEAAAFNQLFRENLRNNFASKVSESLNGRERLTDAEQKTLQAQLDKYADEYEFGVRTGGGGGRDPVMAEAMRIAKDKIFEHLKNKGIKRNTVESAKITEAARKLVAKNPEILEIAKQRVEETRSAAAQELDEVMAGVSA